MSGQVTRGLAYPPFIPCCFERAMGRNLDAFFRDEGAYGVLLTVRRVNEVIWCHGAIPSARELPLKECPKAR